MIQFEVPLPLEGCKPNTRQHWRKVAPAIKLHRREAEIAARQALSTQAPLTVPTRVNHEWFMAKTQIEEYGLCKRYRPLDIGNAIAALKGAIDGIVDAGLIPSDSHKWLQWGDCKLNRSAKLHKGRACVVLTFEPIEESGTP